METSLPLHRFQFAFTIAYHYIFPQLTMGLALVILVMKTIALRTKSPVYDQAALFWARIFGINFAMGVVTGIPLEFQFGTNWAEFTAGSGKVIGQLLAMEGILLRRVEIAVHPPGAEALDQPEPILEVELTAVIALDQTAMRVTSPLRKTPDGSLVSMARSTRAMSASSGGWLTPVCGCLTRSSRT